MEAGYVMRPAAAEDAEAAADVLNEASEAAVGRPDTSATRIRDRWRQPEFDVKRDTRVVFHSDRVVAFSQGVVMAPYVESIYEGGVHPDHRNHGLGTALVEWAKGHAAASAEQADPSHKVVARFGCHDADESARQLFADQGLEHIRSYFEMEIELDHEISPAAFPEGLELLRYDDGRLDLEAAYAGMRDSFRDHFGWVETPFEDGLARLRTWMESVDYDPALWWSVLDGDQYAAHMWCWPKSESDPSLGLVANLGVRPGWRRRGIAMALLKLAFHEFRERGMRGVTLGVDGQSRTGAPALYEKAGMHVAGQWNIYELEIRPGEDITQR